MYSRKSGPQKIFDLSKYSTYPTSTYPELPGFNQALLYQISQSIWSPYDKENFSIEFGKLIWTHTVPLI